MNADQFGFRANRPTIDTAWRFKKLAVLAIKKCQFSTAVILDIQNAINSMPLMHIMVMIENKKVSVYLHSIIQDYVVLAQTASAMIRKEMTCDVPLGSVLGPLL